MEGNTMLATPPNSTIDVPKKDKSYPLPRDAAETKRLNDQHSLFKIYCGQNLIHPSIPKEKIQNIADIGTGTGIWLKDAAELLTTIPTESGNGRSYSGFDISPLQFPKVHQKGMQFSVHDLLEPFPVEYHGKYDLVHLRFLLAALKEDDVKIAVKNIVALLRPNGYVQWDDLRYGFAYNREAPDELRASDQVAEDFSSKFGVIRNLPGLITENFKKEGLQGVIKYEHPPPDTEEKIAAAKALRLEMAAVMPRVFLEVGLAKTEEEAKEMTGRNVMTLQKHFDQGLYPILPLERVIGQKV